MYTPGFYSCTALFHTYTIVRTAALYSYCMLCYMLLYVVLVLCYYFVDTQVGLLLKHIHCHCESVWLVNALLQNAKQR